MKFTILKITFAVLFTIFSSALFSQYNWKLSKEKNGIKVYESEVPHSNYKAIKVECIFEGTYDKLMTVLRNVSHQKDWVYNNKTSKHD